MGGWRAAGLGLALAGCSLANAIDVCDRAMPGAHEVNTRTDGAQRVRGSRPLAPMPFGGALVVWVSDASADPSDEWRTEIRADLLFPDGTPQAKCEGDCVVAGSERAPGELDFRFAPAIAPPIREDGPGAIVFARSDAESSQVVAQFISADLTPYGMPLVEISPRTGRPCTRLLDDLTSPSHCVVAPQVAYLGPAPDGVFHDFAITWIAWISNDPEMFGGRDVFEARGRVVRIAFGREPLFLQSTGIGDAPTSEPVPLVTGGLVIDSVLVPLADRRFAMIWHEDSGALETRYAVFDDRLAREGDVHLVGRASTRPSAWHLSAASDAERLAIAWVEAHGDDERDRVVARLLRVDGSDSALADPIHVAPTSGVQLRPTITALAGGAGFFVAWEEPGSDGEATDIRAAAITPSGELRFVNPACDRGAFSLGNTTGSQTFPAATTVQDGSLLTVWTDDGSLGSDHSLTSVWSLALRPSDLLPLE